MDADPAAVGRRRQVALAGHVGDVDTARRALGDRAAPVRAAALGAMARLDALSEDRWRAGLGDEAAEVRGRACELGPRFGASAAGPLVERLADPDDGVAEAAAFALGELGERATGAVEALAGAARRHADPLVREAAVAALGSVGHRGGLAAILAATSDKPAVRRRAVLALAPFDGPEVDAALDRALHDRDWQVRQAAEDLAGGDRPA